MKLEQSVKKLEDDFYIKNSDKITKFIIDHPGYIDKKEFGLNLAKEVYDLQEELILSTIKNIVDYRIFK